VRADPPLYPFPEELLRIPRHASAVVEASAGTGKTFLLEHLVMDRIVRGDAPLEQILVVTFTEKATEELVRRLRALIGRLLAYEGTASADVTERCWRLDAAARRRLDDARRSFERATITTIHGFCQRVLVDQPFAGRRLLAQRHVDSGKVFGDAFKDTLRRTLAVDQRLASYLHAWLAGGGSVDGLELMLFKARQQRRPWGLPFDERRIDAAAAAFARLPIDFALREVLRRHTDGNVARAGLTRAQTVSEIANRYLQHRSVPAFLREIDDAVASNKERDLFTYLEGRLLRRPPPPGPLARFYDAFFELGQAAVPLALALGQLFRPVVEERLEAHKRAAGLYDFDDMLSLVAEALRGPGGPGLVASLRARYRLAVIDEFQDTDAAQWEIFRAVFGQSGGKNPLYVIGDPKQAIYGFRGADVLSYRAARREICGGERPTVTLRRNYRSTEAVVDACNALFDPAAQPPFFDEPDLYAEPVVCARDGDRGGGAPIVLLAVRPAPGLEVTRLPMREVRQALTRAIADEIEALRAGPAPPAWGEVQVLTRTRAEAGQVAAVLRARGIPHVLYNQEGLYETDEAVHVRDLLAAIADPRDPTLRLRALLTPFFGYTLADLPACATPGQMPELEERIYGWRALAEARDWPAFFDGILDGSGVVRRGLFTGASARQLTNYTHLFELLRAEATRAPVGLDDLVRRLAALAARVTVPPPEEGNVQRLETTGGRDAVQVMTMHKAKGLEADHVFLYGAFVRNNGGAVKTFADGRARVLFAGRPRTLAVERALRADGDAEDQRLLYVALTRARRRLYLPYAGDRKLEDAEGGTREEYFRLSGAYRHVHRRLRTLHDERDARVTFAARDVRCPAPPDPEREARAARLAAWRPEPDALAPAAPVVRREALAALARRAAGVALTSYSRIKQAHGGYVPPTEVLDEVTGAGAAGEEAAGADVDLLPGGALSGTFLHALLEAVPLETLAAGAASPTPSIDGWAARPEVRAVFDAAMRRYDRDPRHRAHAERLVHAALTTPLGGERSLPAVAALAPRVAREVEFLFPLGAGARDFIKGYIDVVFEHEGRTYLADWKSDNLPDWSAEAVAAHVAANYELQRRLYALALVRALDIATEDDYQARFGGTAYLFVRGLPRGVELQRPSWAEVLRWQAELERDLAGSEP
jgi:exodeoxyribonuclease V beta subunit